MKMRERRLPEPLDERYAVLRDMVEFFPLLAFFLLIVIPLPLVIRRERRLKSVMREGTPAFDFKLDIKKIRREPNVWRERLAERVVRVCCVSAPLMSGGGKGGGNVIPVFRSFVIDSNGEVHDLEHGRRFPPIEDNARWFAELIGVEFESRI